MSDTVVCGDENYLVYCVECGRPLHLPEASALSFEHSEELCERNAQKDLYTMKIGVAALRRKVVECGGYYKAIIWYRQSDNRLRYKIC